MTNLEIPYKQGDKCSVCGHYMTCDNCAFTNCEFRNDLYNIDGDCLGEK